MQDKPDKNTKDNPNQISREKLRQEAADMVDEYKSNPEMLELLDIEKEL